MYFGNHNLCDPFVYIIDHPDFIVTIAIWKVPLTFKGLRLSLLFYKHLNLCLCVYELAQKLAQNKVQRLAA